MNLFKNQKDKPLFIIVSVYQSIMAFFVLLHFSELDSPFLWIFFHTFVVLFFWWDKWEKLNNIKIWSVIIIIPINFSELHYLVHLVHPTDFDNLLIQIDYFLFGVHPTVWLEKYTYPLITEILQFVYTTFYFIPIVLAILIAQANRRADLSFFIFNMIYCFYLSYFGYFSVPAIGPRFTLSHLQSLSLTGVWLMQDIQSVLNHLENIQRDAFPSGHTAITVLTLYYAFKYNKSYAYILIPITILMVISTVYLRYHYVIDVIAGLFLVVLSIWSGPKLYKILQKNSSSSMASYSERF